MEATRAAERSVGLNTVLWASVQVSQVRRVPSSPLVRAVCLHGRANGCFCVIPRCPLHCLSGLCAKYKFTYDKRDCSVFFSCEIKTWTGTTWLCACMLSQQRVLPRHGEQSQHWGCQPPAVCLHDRAVGASCNAMLSRASIEVPSTLRGRVACKLGWDTGLGLWGSGCFSGLYQTLGQLRQSRDVRGAAIAAPGALHHRV